MEFRIPKDLSIFVSLIDDTHIYSGPTELTQYFVRETTLNRKEIRGGQYVVMMRISLGRRLTATFLTAFMPTILLVLVGHATNLFKVFFFEVISVRFNVFLEILFKLGRGDSELDRDACAHYDVHKHLLCSSCDIIREND